MLRMSVRFKDGETKNLLVEVGKRMYLSDYGMPSPKYPSNFAMTLRKYLSNAVVGEFKQVGFDRIVEFTIEGKGGGFKLIIELFGEGNGNILLTDSKDVIKAVMKPRRFKHRDLIGKEVYAYPPQRLNPFKIGPEKITEIIKGHGSLVKGLAGPLGLGGMYSEEVCARTGLAKDSKSITLEEGEIIVKTLNELKNEALNPRSVIVYQNDLPVDVTPIKLLFYKNSKTKDFPSFNNALDEFFTEEIVGELEEKAQSKFKEGLKSMNIRLREQAKAIGKFNCEIRDYKIIGDTIYGSFEKVEKLIDTFSKARKTISSKDISEKIKDVRGIKQYLSKENALVVELDDFEFKLDLSLSASKNADQYYSRSKKAREKLKGARGAAEITKVRIKDYIKKGKSPSEEGEKISAKKKVKKRWYERFRWFFSSDGFLVIAGRDATSNETVVKRHMEKGDIFVHADIHGAPTVIVKAEGREVPGTTIDEACQFAALNSIAWKNNAAFLEVYWVTPEQVSKTPESGEYVAKGAFIIRGKRNFRRSKVGLSVGVKVNDEAMVVGGPESSVEKNSDYYVNILPGRMKSKDASQKIKEIILGQATEEEQDTIKRLNVDDIQRVLPTGGYSFKGKKQ
jgi:predicted ribosome quality control (RQC) complex YloA/Tae2 family protein